jgi:multidrug efflux pump
MTAMQELARKLPPGFDYEGTGLSYEAEKSGSQTGLLYAGSLIVVFLYLAALYESWSIPVAVLLVVPLGVVLATLMRGLDNDVYFEVGLLTTIGLSATSAILLVDSAKANFEAVKNLADAAANAACVRLRPILMTLLAFILGVAPLVMSLGAGSGGQNGIGTGVNGGMLSATLLAILMVPVFFVVVPRLFRADNYLPVLTPQQTLYSAQQTLLNLKQAQLATLVMLYKALGGNEHTVAPTSPSRPL